MQKKSFAKIIGLGSFLPEKILTNQDFEKRLDTSDEWIRTRTGILERRICSNDEFPSTMGKEAAKKALLSAKIKPDEIDLIITATMTPDYLCPSTASLIQSLIEAKNAAVFDLQAACSGFIYALKIAKSLVESAAYQNILLVATEKMSSFIDYDDRTTSILFGDGAAACVISNRLGPGIRIDEVTLGADGEFSDLLKIPGGGSKNPTSKETFEKKQQYFRLEGKEVFRHAVRKMGECLDYSLKLANLEKNSIDWFVPHQANIRIIDALQKAYSIPEGKVYKTIHKYGNTSGSSVGIALDELIQEKKVKNEEKIILVAFGAGLTWGSAILTNEES